MQIWSDPSLMIDMLVTERFAELLRLQDPTKGYHPETNPWIRRPDWFIGSVSRLLLQRDVAARLDAFSRWNFNAQDERRTFGGRVTLWRHEAFGCVATNEGYDIGLELDHFETHLDGLRPEPRGVDAPPAGLLAAASDGRKQPLVDKVPSIIEPNWLRTSAPTGAYLTAPTEELAARIVGAIALRDAQSAERDETLAAAIVSERTERRAAVLAEAEYYFPSGGWS